MGVIVPFIVVYIFNWIIFIIIFANLLYKAKSKVSDMKEKKQKSMLKQQFVIALTLSILFGLGWGIGLPATQKLDTLVVRDTFASLFVLFTSFQGFFIFFMHCLRSADVRRVWMKWFKVTTGKDISDLSTSGIHVSRGKKPKKHSEITKSTSVDKPSAKYKSKKQTYGSTKSTSDEFSFVSESDTSTLQRYVTCSGLLEKDSTLMRYGQGIEPEKGNYLPLIEEEAYPEKIPLDREDSDSTGEDIQHKPTTFALPEGVLGTDTFDTLSMDRLSTVSDTKGNIIFTNPMEMMELGMDPFDDTVSIASSTVSAKEASQTFFINPMEDTDDTML